MSSLLFPTLAGITWAIKASPTWSSVVQISKSRARTTIVNDTTPLWKFELSFEFLRASGFQGTMPRVPATNNPRGYSELEQIVGLYNQVQGSAGDFLLDPGLLTRRPQDSIARGVPIGTGDGTTTVFYLARNYGGFMDEVQDPVASTVFISVNGAPVSTWTLGTAGQITFAGAPVLGAVITADFRWQWRVAFTEDELGIDGLTYQLYECKSIKLEQVKR